MDWRQTLGTCLRTILRSYGQIFFSENPLAGALICAATFARPSVGATALLSVVLSNTFAWFLGLDRDAIRRGLYGFNAVLLGLAIGSIYQFSDQLLVLLILASLLVTFLNAALTYVLRTYLGVPAISIPFIFGAWTISLASFHFGGLVPSISDHAVLNQLDASVTAEILRTFLISLGAIIYSPHVLTGALIAVALVIHSRISLIFCAVGLFSATLLRHGLRLDPRILDSWYLGFNPMLTALAVGGVFTVPSPGSVLLAFLAASLSMVLLGATMTVLPEGMLPLAMPFNLATLLTVFALRLRMKPTLGIHLAPARALSPEEALTLHRSSARLPNDWRIPLSLPFFGTWKVTQGFDGRYTHQGKLRFAYDFEAVDSSGNTFLGNGLNVEDYHSYGKPILAPAAGTIISAQGQVADSLIGASNTDEPWGNYVIIQHAAEWFSCIAHLKVGSLRVTPGQKVERGQMVGLCGNSGRSPYPHVHLHFQLKPELDSESQEFFLMDLLVQSDQGFRFLKETKLTEGSLVRNATRLNNWNLYLAPFQDFTYRYRYGGKEETWRLFIDPKGKRFLESSPEKTRVEFRFSRGLLTILSLEGSQRTGLAQFARLVSEMPFVAADQPIGFLSAVESPDVAGPSWFWEAVSLFGITPMRFQDSRLSCQRDSLIAEVRSTAAVRVLKQTLLIGNPRQTEVEFPRPGGVRIKEAGKVLLEPVQ